jgi:N-acetylglucosamine malate deacetylase 1
MPSVLAVAAHPDDIEFVMAGTLLQLAEQGWELHYFNVANGCCGSMTLDRQACAAQRLAEARHAAELLGAHFYPPICDDLAIFYNRELLAQVAAVVRQARPQIVLTHAPLDYMEDHQNAARLAVTAAFSRAMPNFPTEPPVATYGDDVTLYHAQPHGNRTPLGELVRPTHVVDVTSQMERKRAALRAHVSQSNWLDETQGLSSYVIAMEQLNREVGSLSGRFEYGEGWRRHLPLGLCAPEADPLAAALGGHCCAKLSC